MIDKMRELTDRQMLDFVKELEKRRIPLHSVLIAQHGKLIFEKYYAPYCRNKLQRMFSVTKSFTSLAIGLLEQEGKISLQDPICDYFPEYLPGRVHPWLAEMTIENMLKMQTCYNMTTYNKTSTTENWVRAASQIARTAYGINAVLRQPHILKRRRRWIMLWNNSQSTRTAPKG